MSDVFFPFFEIYTAFYWLFISHSAWNNFQLILTYFNALLWLCMYLKWKSGRVDFMDYDCRSYFYVYLFTAHPETTIHHHWMYVKDM